MRIQAPPERKPPNFQFGGGLKPFVPFGRPESPLLSAFLDEKHKINTVRIINIANRTVLAIK